MNESLPPEPLDLADVIQSLRLDIQQRLEAGSAVTGLATGFTEIDDITEGLKPGELIVLCGRPAMGKTMLAMNIAYNVARTGRTSLVFSTQLSAKGMAMRLTSATSGVTTAHMINGQMSQDEWQLTDKAMDGLKDLPLLLDDTRSMDAEHIVSKSRKVMRDHKIDLVVVDGLQELLPSHHISRKEDRGEMIDAMRTLKHVALQCGAPVLLTSQLRRSTESRNNHKPILTDLRHFKHVQHMLDSAWMLYRDSYYNRHANPKSAELNVPIQQNGKSGWAQLYFEEEVSRFLSLMQSRRSFE